MRKILLILLMMIVISCGDDSENKSANPVSQNEHVGGEYYNTFAELAAEKPCMSELYGTIAHIGENGASYVCLYDESLNLWNWKALLNVGGSSEGTVLFSSSSLSNMIVVSSSSKEMESLAELAGTSCNDYYMSYSQLFGIYPELKEQVPSLAITGTTQSLNCVQQRKDVWIWEIVDNDELRNKPKSSSSSFVFGTFTDPRDEQTYKTIGVRRNIGTEKEIEEIWFVEDLKYDCEEEPCVYNWQKALQKTCVRGGACLSPSLREQGLCPDGWFVQNIDYVMLLAESYMNEKIHEDGADYWTSHWSTRSKSLPWIEDSLVSMSYTRVETRFGGDGCNMGICSRSVSVENSAWLDQKFRVRCVKYDEIPSGMSIVDVCATVKSEKEWNLYDDCREINADPKLMNTELSCTCNTSIRIR